MSIKYYIRRNNLKKDTREYRATVVHRNAVDMDQVIDRIINQGTTVNVPDILGVFANFEMAIHHFLEEGCSVRTPFANFSSSIKGIFTEITDNFNPEKHKIVAVVNPGKNLRKFYKKGHKTQKVRHDSHVPNPRTFTDVISGEENKVITPNGMGKIRGSYLKYDHEDPAHGIFFKSTNKKEFRVTIIGQNKPSTLFFMIPEDLPKGQYRIHQRNERGSGILYKDLTVE